MGNPWQVKPISVVFDPNTKYGSREGHHMALMVTSREKGNFFWRSQLWKTGVVQNVCMLPRCFAGKSSFTCSLGFASQVWIFTVIVYYVVFICFYIFLSLLACLFAGWMNGCMIDQLTINYWIYWLFGQLIGWLMGWWVLIWLVGWLIGSLIGWNDVLVGSQWWIVFSFVDCCFLIYIWYNYLFMMIVMDDDL